jgi:MoaA/NifB/PqqE/SkfB family radical SAM enzyme
MKKGINLYLATSTVCNVRCKTCPVGRKEYEPGGSMSLDMMERILDKCLAEARVITVQLYHYNEPMLHPKMADMVRACHKRGVPVFLSSNLVNFKNVPAVLAEEPETLLISVSGFTQSVYERSHKDGDIEKVKQNMREVARLRKPKTHVQVSWHKYRYNEHEEPLMQALSDELGFFFNPYGTGLIPHDRAMKVWATGVEDPNGEDCLIPVKDAGTLCYDRRWWPCTLQDQILAVNGEGIVMNCSNFSDEANLRGNLFDTTVEEIFRKRKTDPACLACKSVGGHVYALQEYTRRRFSPMKLAEIAYRRLGLAGRSAKFSAWVTRRFYIRPQEKKTI